MAKHSSTHRTEAGAKKVERKFHQMHLDAGYHLQEWGEPSTPEHELHGRYRCVRDGQEMELTVSHVPRGPSGGPEFAISWDDGMQVTVMDNETALQYLERDQAEKTS